MDELIISDEKGEGVRMEWYFVDSRVFLSSKGISDVVGY